jgi:hypothetical protein
MRNLAIMSFGMIHPHLSGGNTHRGSDVKNGECAAGGLLMSPDVLNGYSATSPLRSTSHVNGVNMVIKRQFLFCEMKILISRMLQKPSLAKLKPCSHESGYLPIRFKF